jgi:hypothetical protein
MRGEVPGSRLAIRLERDRSRPPGRQATSHRRWAFCWCVTFAALLASGRSPAEVEVAVAEKPGRSPTFRLTRTLADLPSRPADPPGDAYGGQPAAGSSAAGFFDVAERDGRWWLVDPAGGLFVSRGVNSVTPTPTAGGQTALAALFGTEAGWAEQTSDLLRMAGFNTLGAWSNPMLRDVEQPLASTRNWNFMSAYGRRRGGTFSQPGHTGYPGGCPFVFDPGFAEFCLEHAEQLAATRDDPWLLGHFSDNELPWKRTLLESYLALPDSDPGRRAAAAWLTDRRSKQSDHDAITEQERADFLEFAVERYLAAVTAAIRRHDPNHLFLGMRLHGSALRLPEVWRACGRHCDVVSVNYYHAWTPSPERMAMWLQEAGRPFLVTEFYAKAADSGLENTSGAGWVVETQADRGRFYQHFTLGLLAAPGCVGWHWHRYADNDPAAEAADASNLDSNKGLVSARYRSWQPLVAEMKALNDRVYGLRAAAAAQSPGP